MSHIAEISFSRYLTDICFVKSCCWALQGLFAPCLKKAAPFQHVDANPVADFKRNINAGPNCIDQNHLDQVLVVEITQILLTFYDISLTFGQHWLNLSPVHCMGNLKSKLTCLNGYSSSSKFPQGIRAVTLNSDACIMFLINTQTSDLFLGETVEWLFQHLHLFLKETHLRMKSSLWPGHETLPWGFLGAFIW